MFVQICGIFAVHCDFLVKLRNNVYLLVGNVTLENQSLCTFFELCSLKLSDSANTRFIKQNTASGMQNSKATIFFGNKIVIIIVWHTFFTTTTNQWLLKLHWKSQHQDKQCDTYLFNVLMIQLYCLLLHHCSVHSCYLIWVLTQLNIYQFYR